MYENTFADWLDMEIVEILGSQLEDSASFAFARLLMRGVTRVIFSYL